MANRNWKANSYISAVIPVVKSKTDHFMKIDTTKPRLPIDRLKRPVKQKSLLPVGNENNEQERSAFSENFERDFLKKGAEEFKEWLVKCELK